MLANPVSPPDIYDLIVIGAGISGLSMAQFASAAGYKVLLLEQAERAGGCLHTQRLTGTDFWMELGAHSIFNSYGTLLALLETAHGLHDVQRRHQAAFRIYADDQAHSIFSQLHLWDLLGAVRYLCCKPSKAGRSVAEYFLPLVGERNYRAVFEPAFSAVISQPAGAFPAAALFNPRRRRSDVPRHLTLRGGLQTLVERFSAGMQLQLKQAVLAVQHGSEQCRVRTTESVYQSRAVCLATAPRLAAPLLRDTLPQLAALLAEIPSATVESVGVILPQHMAQLPYMAGLIGREQPFYSVVTRDALAHAQYRGFTFHFRPGVLDAHGQERCIAHTLKLPADWQRSAHIVRKNNQLPALRVGHQQRNQRIDTLLAGTRLALTGNYFNGVSLEDCALRSQQEWQRLQQECYAL